MTNNENTPLHVVQQAEHEFFKAFVTILEHLKQRADKAEAECEQLRRELKTRREQVEYYTKPKVVDAA